MQTFRQRPKPAAGRGPYRYLEPEELTRRDGRLRASQRICGLKSKRQTSPSGRTIARCIVALPGGWIAVMVVLVDERHVLGGFVVGDRSHEVEHPFLSQQVEFAGEIFQHGINRCGDLAVRHLTDLTQVGYDRVAHLPKYHRNPILRVYESQPPCISRRRQTAVENDNLSSPETPRQGCPRTTARGPCR